MEKGRSSKKTDSQKIGPTKHGKKEIEPRKLESLRSPKCLKRKSNSDDKQVTLLMTSK